MPPLIVAVAAAAASAATAAALSAPLIAAGFATAAGALSWGGALIAGVAGAVVAAGVGYGLSAAFGLNRQPKAVSARAQDRKQAIRSSVAPRQVVYGTVRVSGPIVYASSSGGSKQFLHLVIPVAGHRVDSPLALWVNDDRIPWANGMVTTGRYANRLRMFFANGNQTTANADLVAETGGEWTADHVLRETAYMYVRLDYDRDVFSNGPGALSVELRGHNQIVDPRTNTTGYSSNPALCILHYLMSADGLACSAEEIDTASFIAAANVCDEVVTIDANGATQRRYSLDGTFTLDQKPIDVIDDMLSACAGSLVYVQGRYRLYAGAYDAPTDTLTASDLAGSAELVTKPPRRELFNTVRGTFINPARNWQASEFPAYSETALVSADGEAITRDVEWPFTTDEIRAQRLAKLTLRRAREALTVRVPVKYAGLRYAVWQTLNVTLADFGWTNKPFRIVAWAFDAESGIINLTLREESAASYSWQFGDASPLPLAPDTALVDPLAVPAPSAVTVTPSTALQADGSVAPALVVTWTPSPFAFLVGHEVEWQLANTQRITEGGTPRQTEAGIARATEAFAPNLVEVPVGVNRHVIAPVLVGTNFAVRVRGVTGIARGAWSSTVTAAGAPDVTAPDAPTNLGATGITRGIGVAWALPAATDLAAVEVWENTSNDAGGRYFVGEARGTGFVRTGLAPNVARWFWVRARDLSGNVSGFTGPVSATSSLLVADDIQNGIIDTAKFANTIEPVGLVNSLPTAKGSNPNTVFNTTDGKLYRWNGTAYVSAGASNFSELEGQITQTQIADNAVSTPKLAANAVTSDKIVANAITAGKIAAAAISSTEIAAGAVRAVNLASETLITSAAQLGSAVVGSAQIADAAISNAKIGNLQVDTIKIANNAVISSAAASWSGGHGGGYASLASVSIGDALGGTYVVSVDIAGTTGFLSGGAGIPGWLELRVLRNGNSIRVARSPDSVGWTGAGNNFRAAVVLDFPGTGTHTYTLQGSSGGAGGGTVTSATIIVEQVKR